MANITLEGIAALLKEELKPINERLEAVEQRLGTMNGILDTHTTVLDQLLTEKKTRGQEDEVASSRFDRLEKWGKTVGDKVGIKLEL